MTSNKLAHHARSVIAYGTTSLGALLAELLVLHSALALHVASPLAVSLGFFTGSLFQFCSLRYVVFRVTHKPIIFQANAYVVAAIASWWAVLGAVALFEGVFKLPTMQARIASIPLLFPLNYLVSRYFIFRD